MRRTFLLLGVAAATFATTARAEVPATAAASIEGAYADFDALAAKTRAEGKMPRWSVPSDRAVLERMFDPAVLGAAPYTAKDFPPTLKILSKETALLKAYLSFSPDATPAQPDKNLFLFQDEGARISAMLIRIDAVYVPSIAKLIGAQPPEQQSKLAPAVAKLNQGIAQELSGASAMIGSTALRDDNRAILVDALAASATPIAAGLTLATRDAVTASFNATLPTLTPDETTKIQTVIAAMASKDCTGLCAMK